MPQAQIVHQFWKPDQLVLLAVPFFCADLLVVQGSRAMAETDMAGCCHRAAEPCEQLQSQTWRLKMSSAAFFLTVALTLVAFAAPNWAGWRCCCDPLKKTAPVYLTVARQCIVLLQTLHVHSRLPVWNSLFTVYEKPRLSTSFRFPFRDPALITS